MEANLIALCSKDKRVFVCDLFTELSEYDPTIMHDIGDKIFTRKYLAIAKEEVINNFRKYNLLNDDVIFLEGWFKSSIPTFIEHKFSLLRLDGDIYESTKDTLENLYEDLNPGAYIIVDDWTLNECRNAILDFRNERKINNPIQSIDKASVFWKKS